MNMKDEDYNIKPDDNYTATVSANDCTGLIPGGTVTEKTIEQYKELYPFGAPDVKPSGLQSENAEKDCKAK